MAERTCKTCGETFEHRKVKKYCSYECTPKRNKECEKCGDPFVDTARTNMSKYCDSCQEEKNKTASRKKTCAYRHCDNDFHDDSSHNSRKYCDKGKCSYKEKKWRAYDKHGGEEPVFLDELTRECTYCNKEFTPTKSHQEYCSSQCRNDESFEERYEEVPDSLSRHVTCLECGEEFRSKIPDGRNEGEGHLMEEHDMSAFEYQQKHDGAPIYSEASVYKQRNKSFEWDDESKNNWSKDRLRYWSKDGNDVWNKGLTKEDHPSLMEGAKKRSETMMGENNHFYGKSHDDDTLELLSEIGKDCWKDPDYVKKWMKTREGTTCVSRQHATLMQAMSDVGIYHDKNFDYEKYVKIYDEDNGIHIPCRIDILSRSNKIAIEIDGCPWHKCPDCGSYEKLSEENQKTVDARVIKDRLIDLLLPEQHDYTVIRFWTHDIENDLPGCISDLVDLLDYDLNYEYPYSYSQKKNDLDDWILEATEQK